MSPARWRPNPARPRRRGPARTTRPATRAAPRASPDGHPRGARRLQPRGDVGATPAGVLALRSSGGRPVNCWPNAPAVPYTSGQRGVAHAIEEKSVGPGAGGCAGDRRGCRDAAGRERADVGRRGRGAGALHARARGVPRAQLRGGARLSRGEPAGAVAENTRLYIARCLGALGRNAEAFVEFQRAAAEAADRAHAEPRFAATRDAARAEAATLKPRVGRITVHVPSAPANVVVSVNGAAMPSGASDIATPVDPGAVEVTATAPGRRPLRQTVQVPAGQIIATTVELKIDRCERERACGGGDDHDHDHGRSRASTRDAGRRRRVARSCASPSGAARGRGRRAARGLRRRGCGSAGARGLWRVGLPDLKPLQRPDGRVRRVPVPPRASTRRSPRASNTSCSRT